MTLTETYTLQNIIARLKCDPVRWQDGSMHPGESDEVRDALLSPDVRLYLDTWVVPALAMLLPGDDRDPELALQLSSR